MRLEKLPKQTLAQHFGGERGLGILLPILFALALSLLFYWQNQRFISLNLSAIETVATIIEKSAGPAYHGDRPGAIQYRMQISFSVDGILRRGEVSVGRAFYRTHDEGERVPIRYLPSDPQIREVDPTRQGRFIKEWIMIIGLVLAIGVYNFFTLKSPPRSDKGETK